ncbi:MULTISPECIES: hypothetical protein [Bacillati]|uniref:Uncharacterized protein n=1 Tax=Staphylococcus hominis TaxID=1290 RepID=A0A8X8GQU0_STAHO|nr:MULTISPECIES: hypothetical protein [Terrabacteria group]EUZ69609.1 hypothetical protein O552_00689 [Staphylococcus sp. M0480]MBE7331263.1 hypothetical protein [Staphylococcus haemolyticus]MBO0379807.1 hypothetical protein [Staphylococcus hominis]MCA4764649.1 hypothetical protein [Mycobacterium avium subsp. hominissuis]MCM5673613.1 hypothetical protein [Staphylococcus hominis]
MTREEYEQKLDDVTDEYMQVYGDTPEDILKDEMTDYEKIKAIEQAIQKR